VTAAAEFDPATAPPETEVLDLMGDAYKELLESDRDYLMLQLQSYAACDDEVIRERVPGSVRLAHGPGAGAIGSRG
jgi:hypothetical protein